MTRRTVVASGFEATAIETVRAIEQIGGYSFDLSYTAVNRRLKPDEEPVDTDTVRWTAQATFRTPLGTGDIIGTHDVEPGGSHATAIQRACAQLLERCGANVVVLNPDNEPDPRETGGRG